MRRAATRPTIALALAFGALALCGSGCAVQYPKHEPGPDAVLDAASRVITARYPMSSPVPRSGLVVATTDVDMDGMSKSRMTIVVHVRRNFTGAWEPVVRVRKYLETGEPPLGGDPGAEDPGYASLSAEQDWTVLQNMSVLEKRIRDEILEELAARVI